MANRKKPTMKELQSDVMLNRQALMNVDQYVRLSIKEIVQALKGMLPVLSIEHRLLEERPTTDEHHGGIQSE